MRDEKKDDPRIGLTGESKKPCLFLPFLGEFGMMICHYIKFVHFYKCPRKIVMCAREDRVFYPSADEFIDYQLGFGRPDFYNLMNGKDKGTPNESKNLPSCGLVYGNAYEIAQAIHPECNIPLFSEYLSRGITNLHFDLNINQNSVPNFDVSIGGRGKSFFNVRNYNDWDKVSCILSSKNIKIATVGSRISSCEIERTVPSWFFGNDSSFSCAILKNSKLYVGTDSGITHLACFLQVPTLLIKFSSEINSKMGRYGKGPYGMINELVSINKNFIRLSNNWNYPGKVAKEIEECLEELK